MTLLTAIIARTHPVFCLINTITDTTEGNNTEAGVFHRTTLIREKSYEL